MKFFIYKLGFLNVCALLFLSVVIPTFAQKDSESKIPEHLWIEAITNSAVRLEKEHKNESVLMKQAKTLIENADYEAALAKLNAVVPNLPDEGEPLAVRAYIYLKLKKTDAARIDAEKAVSRLNNSALTYDALGEVNWATNKTTEAFNNFNLAKAIDYDDKLAADGIRRTENSKYLENATINFDMLNNLKMTTDDKNSPQNSDKESIKENPPAPNPPGQNKKDEPAIKAESAQIPNSLQQFKELSAAADKLEKFGTEWIEEYNTPKFNKQRFCFALSNAKLNIELAKPILEAVRQDVDAGILKLSAIDNLTVSNYEKTAAAQILRLKKMADTYGEGCFDAFKESN